MINHKIKISDFNKQFYFTIIKSFENYQEAAKYANDLMINFKKEFNIELYSILE
jgi:hypothetical protein